MSDKKLRCRAQVWERSRWINAYQCNRAATTTRELRGERGLIEVLPVCTQHAKGADPGAYYPLRDDPFHAKAAEYVR